LGVAAAAAAAAAATDRNRITRRYYSRDDWITTKLKYG
jgi:hypothetical protein